MQDILKIEGKRILKTKMLLVFVAAVIILSVSSSYQAVGGYEIWDENGVVETGKENIKQAKRNANRNELTEAIAMRGRADKAAVYVDETNIESLVSINYEGKTAKDLTNREISQFYDARLKTIAQMLEESSHFSYTESEKQNFLAAAGQLDSLSIGFAEGWKVLNRDIGNFIPLVLILISILLMPLFADDSQTNMKELRRATKKGKKTLNLTRVVLAYGIGSILYLAAILCYFIAKMVPFGLSGSGEYIQSNADTFFSVYVITYLEQFILNCFLGYAALILVISLTIFISSVFERLMVGLVVTSFYWILLLVMDQMQQFEVNHWFANFMPLRLAGRMHFYNINEIYRFAGNTFPSIAWCPIIAVALSVIFTIVSVVRLNHQT